MYFHLEVKAGHIYPEVVEGEFQFGRKDRDGGKTRLASFITTTFRENRECGLFSRTHRGRTFHYQINSPEP